MKPPYPVSMIFYKKKERLARKKQKMLKNDIY
jgi:hypothetical protein